MTQTITKLYIMENKSHLIRSPPLYIAEQRSQQSCRNYVVTESPRTHLYLAKQQSEIVGGKVFDTSRKYDSFVDNLLQRWTMLLTNRVWIFIDSYLPALLRRAPVARAAPTSD